MKIYDVIKSQLSSTNLVFVVGNQDGHILSELGRIFRSLKMQTEGKKLLYRKYKIGSYGIDYQVFSPLATFFFF
jgi:hypothetical protein